MKLLPSIKFVDKMPKKVIRSLNITKNQKLLGCCLYRPDSIIYVLNQKRKWLVLCHELVHWVIFVFFGDGGKIHKWLDKYFTVQQTGPIFQTNKK